MNAAHIWLEKREDRFALFIDRWKEIDQYTGCRTQLEKDEMAEIADAIIPGLLEGREAAHILCEMQRTEISKLRAEIDRLYKLFIKEEFNK